MNPVPALFYWLLPTDPPMPDEVAGVVLSFQFHQEVEHRQAFADYCQWYETIAQEHQGELERMRQETNFFQWFSQPKF
jgi:hypothetical protein